MANNYKVKTYSNSTTGTSQALFTASAATTIVKSVLANCDKSTPNVNAILRIKKSGGTEEMIKRQNITVQNSSYEMLYDVLPLEVGDALYAQSDDTDITWIMSWVESTTSVIGQSIDVLSDVDTTGKANGDVLTYNSTSGNWEAEPSAGGGGNTFSTIAVAGQSNVVADTSADTLTLVAGTGVTLTTNASTDTVTITNSATGANAFGNVAVAGQTTVAADTTNDTLSLAAGTGISLTTDAASDTITITNTVTAPNTFGAIAVATQTTVLADSTADTLTLAVAGGMAITTDATTDTITFDSKQLDDDDVTLQGARLIEMNGESLTLFDGSGDIAIFTSDSVKLNELSVGALDAATAGYIALLEAANNGTNYVRIGAPTNLAASTTYTLPSADGISGQLLSTNGSGGLSFVTRKATQVTGKTVTTGSWSLVSGFYRATISDAAISATSIVDVIPDNADAATAATAGMLPRTDSNSGSVYIYATTTPAASITVTLNIFDL